MITKTTVSTKASDSVLESVWLDEDGLKHKYKNKPEQFKAVLTTAQSFVHPVRGVKLYEDVEYKSAEMNRSSATESVEASSSTEKTVKPPKKKPKTEA